MHCHKILLPPNNIEELNVPVIDHAITEKAKDLVLKDIRKMSARKKELKMSSCNIVFKINYKKCKNKKIEIKSWMNYHQKNKKQTLLVLMK